MSYITTVSGIHFYPLDPNPDDIDINDIAHALSLICRANGHFKYFYSVAQHCIACANEAIARGYSLEVILGSLLHDASECYMSDIPRPFKKELPEYREHEEHLLDMIYGKFLGSPLTQEEQAQLKAIDDALLWYDLTILLDEKPRREEPVLYFKPDYTVRPFAEVEREYLEMFMAYSGQ